MSRKFGDNEDIKIRATMFDGYARDPKDIGNKTLHISLFADISKGSDSETWQFACSVWPGRLEVQWVSPLRSNTELARPYFGGEMRFGLVCFRLNFVCKHVSDVSRFAF